jgi:pantoate--beta-alanine ligase
MVVCESLEALRLQISSWRAQGDKIGFVPTMGNLHQGHLSLVEIAKQQVDRVVVSIFVNPLQFGEGEDYATYPRTLAEDQAKLIGQDCDMVFCPDVKQIYPQGAVSTRVLAAPELANLWEGASRPGHFDGVCTVVAKLFNMVQPDLSVFGQKDYQQWTILRRMVSDLNWPIMLVKAPISRDSDGLALSSRNQYLTPAQRKIAPKLFVVLQDVVTAIKSGNKNLRELEATAVQQLVQEGFDRVDYVAIVDPLSLVSLESPQTNMTVIAVARLGTTRLLDNIELNYNE